MSKVCVNRKRNQVEYFWTFEKNSVRKVDRNDFYSWYKLYTIIGNPRKEKNMTKKWDTSEAHGKLRRERKRGRKERIKLFTF